MERPTLKQNRNPEALLDMLAMQSLRQRHSDQKPLTCAMISDIDALVQNFTIDDTIAECFAACDRNTKYVKKKHIQKERGSGKKAAWKNSNNSFLSNMNSGGSRKLLSGGMLQRKTKKPSSPRGNSTAAPQRKSLETADESRYPNLQNAEHFFLCSSKTDVTPLGLGSAQSKYRQNLENYANVPLELSAHKHSKLDQTNSFKTDLTTCDVIISNQPSSETDTDLLKQTIKLNNTKSLRNILSEIENGGDIVSVQRLVTLTSLAAHLGQNLCLQILLEYMSSAVHLTSHDKDTVAHAAALEAARSDHVIILQLLVAEGLRIWDYQNPTVLEESSRCSSAGCHGYMLVMHVLDLAFEKRFENMSLNDIMKSVYCQCRTRNYDVKNIIWNTLEHRENIVTKTLLLPQKENDEHQEEDYIRLSQNHTCETCACNPCSCGNEERNTVSISKQLADKNIQQSSLSVMTSPQPYLSVKKSQKQTETSMQPIFHKNCSVNACVSQGQVDAVAQRTVCEKSADTLDPLLLSETMRLPLKLSNNSLQSDVLVTVTQNDSFSKENNPSAPLREHPSSENPDKSSTCNTSYLTPAHQPGNSELKNEAGTMFKKCLLENLEQKTDNKFIKNENSEAIKTRFNTFRTGNVINMLSSTSSVTSSSTNVLSGDTNHTDTKRYTKHVGTNSHSSMSIPSVSKWCSTTSNFTTSNGSEESSYYSDDNDGNYKTIVLNLEHEELDCDQLSEQRLHRHLQSVRKQSYRNSDYVESVIAADGRRLSDSTAFKLSEDRERKTKPLVKETHSDKFGSLFNFPLSAAETKNSSFISAGKKHSEFQKQEEQFSCTTKQTEWNCRPWYEVSDDDSLCLNRSNDSDSDVISWS